MHCPKCHYAQFTKNGFVRGLQRYYCKSCGCNFTQSHKHGHPMKDKILAVVLHLSGMSMNSIAPIIGVSTQTIMRWIKAHADLISMPLPPAQAVEVEIDEMHHFLKKRLNYSGYGKCWIITPALYWAGSVAVVIKPPGKG